MRLINDCHLGVKRQAGTTPESRRELEDAQFESFESQLPGDEHLMILGDLFDTAKVSFNIVWRTYKILAKYLRTASNTLYLVRGNHDASNVKGEMCSLDFLAELLKEAFGTQSVYITEPYTLKGGARVIPHLPNQDLFDLEVEKADKEGIHTLLLHCNYNNFFATESDHSLNITEEQAKKFGTIICAHEHTPRQMILAETTVWILGCQYPTSIADCKNADVLTSTSYEFNTGDLTRNDVLPLQEVYMEFDWQELDKQAHKFIRVTGEATVEQAGDAVQAISKFRKKSDALVITNSVKIAGLSSEKELEQATEDISEMDVTQMLLDELKPWQVSAIKKLQAGEPVSLVGEHQC